MKKLETDKGPQLVSFAHPRPRGPGGPAGPSRPAERRRRRAGLRPAPGGRAPGRGGPWEGRALPRPLGGPLGDGGQGGVGAAPARIASRLSPRRQPGSSEGTSNVVACSGATYPPPPPPLRTFMTDPLEEVQRWCPGKKGRGWAWGAGEEGRWETGRPERPVLPECASQMCEEKWQRWVNCHSP